MKELCKSLGVWLGNDTKILCVDELLFSAANNYVSIGFCSLHLQVICKRSKDMEMKWWDVLETRCLDLPGTLRWVSAPRFGSPRQHQVTQSHSEHTIHCCTWMRCSVISRIRSPAKLWQRLDSCFFLIDTFMMENSFVLTYRVRYMSNSKRHGRLHQPSHSVSLWAIYTPEITRIRLLVSWFLPAGGTSREVHSDT